MPELRKDPVIGRWVIISTERAKRPHDFVTKNEEAESSQDDCPFCEGKEDKTPLEITALRDAESSSNGPGWKVRVVPSLAPLLQIEGDMGRRGKGMYDLMNGIGAHEIIIDTPEHIANIANLEEEQIARVFGVYTKRMEDLKGDDRIKYVLIFKNHGIIAGASSIKHSRTQLIAMPVNPRRVKEELIGARRYYEYKKRCIFCDMIQQEIKTNARIIAREGGFIALTPFASRFPFEIMVLPEEHSCDFYQLKNTKGLAKVMRSVLKKLSIGLKNPPYNYIIHTAPFRRMASAGYWKTIDQDYHWHIEIMPRLTKMAGFEWGSGFYINPTSPEAAADYLKGVEI
ncbi:MAG: DUF4921 family protein [PVC group bacterium]|nr:DUF4921 family protein [PVC group bacterium]